MLEGLSGLFAGEYPATSAHLATPGLDPDVERVREALWMLAGTAADKAADFAIEGHDSLGDILCPALLRPVPSATVLELTATSSRLVVKGALAATKTGVQFALTENCVVAPIRIENVRIRLDEGLRRRLEFELVSTNHQSLDSLLDDTLDLFAAGGTDGAAKLALALAGSTVRATTEEGAEPVMLRFALGDWKPLVPEADGPPQPSMLLRDYFQLPSRFAFVKLQGLAKLRERPPSTRLQIRVALPPGSDVANVRDDSLRPNCCVAVNLFDATLDPVLVDPLRLRAALRVAGLPLTAEVFEVLAVAAVVRGTGAGPYAIPPLRRLGVQSLDPRAPYVFTLGRDVAGRAELAFSSPVAMPPPAAPLVVSGTILATNGSGAAGLPPGSVCVGDERLKGVVVRNIVPTSWAASVPFGLERQLRIDSFAQVPGTFVSLDALRAILLALVPTRGVPETVARAHRRKIEAIESVDVTVASADHGDGYLVSLSVDESAFEGAGDVEIFATVVHRVISSTASLDAPIRLEARLRVAGATYVVNSHG
jgi:type VI secretion system protein ImpG